MTPFESFDPKKGIAYNAQGVSRSFWGDFFKLGGSRHVAGEDWRSELLNPHASTMGRMQGGPGWIRIPGIHTFHYTPGSFGDNLVEAYAGVHDFLNSWSYDTYGNNTARQGLSKFFSEVTNYANVVPATPFAVAAAYSHYSLVDPMRALSRKE